MLRSITADNGRAGINSRSVALQNWHACSEPTHDVQLSDTALAWLSSTVCAGPCGVFRRVVQANAPAYLRPLKGRSHDVMSAFVTFETCRWTLKMSAYRGRPEVIGARSN